MLISVIIPTYNRAETIARSIESVLHQTIKELEVIVVDDCSQDNTKTIVTSINDERVRYCCLEQNSGACVARNRGIEEARGDIIAFQDSDDEWESNKLEIQLNALVESKADICFCRLRRHNVNDSDKVIIWPENAGDADRMMDNVTLRRQSYVSTQTIIAKKEVCAAIRFDPKVKKSQDYDWIIRASQAYKTYYVAEPLVEQYLQKDSISMGNYQSFITSREYLLEKYSDICVEDRVFKLYLLKQLAHYKSLSGIDAKAEYHEIYLLEKNPHNFVCMVLAQLSLLNVMRGRNQ